MDFIQALPSLVTRNLLANLDMVVLFGAFYLMSHLVKRTAKGQGLDPNAVADLAYWVTIGALVGARLGHAVPAMEQQLSHPLDLVHINGGLYFYGALAGGLAVGSWLAKRRQLPFWAVADMYGLYAPLAIAVTRFGCLLWNTCYGVTASPPLGIVFPGLTQARYPSELYEGLLALALFGGLAWISQLRPSKGTLFLTFLIGYPLARALSDLTRINLGGGGLGAIDILLSIGVALVAATLLWVRWTRAGRVAMTVSLPDSGQSEVLR